MVGGSGADMFTGGAAVDKLMGGGGADELNGGGEADIITGGAGGDTLTGGDGNDVFKYASASESQMSGFDTVTDWVSGDTFLLGQSSVQRSAPGGTIFAKLLRRPGSTARTTTTRTGALKDSLKGLARRRQKRLQEFDGYRAGNGCHPARHHVRGRYLSHED